MKIWQTTQNYLELCKPRVVILMLLTAIIGMVLASPENVSLNILFFGLIGIGLAAAAGAVLNHVADQRIDAIMARTRKRPLPMGHISQRNAFIFAFILLITGLLLIATRVNGLTAILTFLTFIGYAVIYTLILKRITAQNIVIGGLAGAMPPLLGWVAVSNHIDPSSWLLVLIIFIWTPPHFWALAIARAKDYESADIPMLPVTHGVAYTKINILLYTILLFAVSLLPFVVQMSGIIYAIGAVILNSRFLYWTIRLKRTTQDEIIAMRTFRYSIFYLTGLFVLLLVDHYLLIR
jgi:protoheme IX farnesyltransferase